MVSEDMIRDQEAEIMRTIVSLMAQGREKREEIVEGHGFDGEAFSASQVLTNRVSQVKQVFRKLDKSCQLAERAMAQKNSHLPS